MLSFVIFHIICVFSPSPRIKLNPLPSYALSLLLWFLLLTTLLHSIHLSVSFFLPMFLSTPCLHPILFSASTLLSKFLFTSLHTRCHNFFSQSPNFHYFTASLSQFSRFYLWVTCYRNFRNKNSHNIHTYIWTKLAI